MSEIDFTGVALVLTAFGTLVTAVGIAIVGIMTARHRKVLNQVEKQGNSVSLELKRTNMVYAMRLAVAERTEANLAIAKEAKTVYEEARKQVEADAGIKP